MPDVILLGDINIDIISHLPAYPSFGTEGVASSIEYHAGGGIVNTAFAMANMGASVGVVARIGSDPLADNILADLKASNVDTSRIQIDKTVNTGLIYIVVTPDGERTMFSSRGANVFTRMNDHLSDYFEESRWYHISGYTLLAEPQSSTALSGLERARNTFCRISLDPGLIPAMQTPQKLRDLFPFIDVFLPSKEELLYVTGGMSFQDAINDVLASGVKAVVVTRGGAGCVVAYEHHYYEIPGFEIQVKDTTGAGDSFNGGLTLGRMVGLSWPAAAVLGNALGGIAAAHVGSGIGSVNQRQVEELIIHNQFKPQWADWQPALEEVLAWLTS